MQSQSVFELPGDGKAVTIVAMRSHEDMPLIERNIYTTLRVVLALSALALLTLPLPALAQGAAPVPTSLVKDTTPALVSLALLVIGLLAVGLVAVKVTGLPGPGTRITTPSAVDDDELIEDDHA
jgi:hypothetical protein